LCGGDCDDDDPANHPGNEEVCDGADNDCDGAVSAGEEDVDLDGYAICEGDCDDTDPALSPGLDEDGDGFTPCSGDCDDSDATRFEGHAELCDRIDNDCDGELSPGELDVDLDGFAICEGDCDDEDVLVTPADADGDGFTSCDLVPDCDDWDPGLTPADLDFDGYSSCDGDCDDASAAARPGLDEVCDGADNNCDGVLPADEQDADADTVATCDGDCDDTDASINPLDSDSDGVSTCDDPADCDDADASLDPLDADSDGVTSCDGDCDDANPAVAPGLPEVCDGLDNDCLGGVPADEVDGDGDGFPQCDDCDDTDTDVFPGNWLDAPTDGLDGNCDGVDGYDLAAADVRIDAESEGDRLGWDLVAVGDLWGDGQPELAVVADSVQNAGFGDQIGRAYVLDSAGLTGDSEAGVAPTIIQGTPSVISFVRYMAICDFGDGDLLLIEANSPGPISHLVFAMSTLEAGGLLEYPDADEQLNEFPHRFSCIDDLDGDGAQEFVFSGSGMGLVSGAEALSAGTVDREDAFYDSEAACTVTEPIPDLDSDGLSELAVCGSDGVVYVLPAAEFSTTPAASFADAALASVAGTLACPAMTWGPYSVRAIGDLDGDGLAELVAGGTPGVDVYAGSGLAAGGELDGADAWLTIASSTWAFGHPVVPGDFDGDGLADLFVGAAADPGEPVGFVFLGPTLLSASTLTESDADVVFVADTSTSGSTSMWTGRSADMNGDGRDDLLLGNTSFESSAGRAYVLLSTL